MDHKLVIDTAVLAGEILLKSGAETETQRQRRRL